MSKFVGRIVSLAVLSPLFIVALFAQSLTGDMVIHTADPSGAVVVNAKLVLTDVETNVKQESVTDTLGNAMFGQLKPGTYKLEVMAPGFQGQSVTDVRVQVGQRARVDVKMAVGQLTETV